MLPELTLGHSLGEFAAAATSGMLPGADAVKLVARRGQLMNELGLKDPGAMLAVMAERSKVEKLLDRRRRDRQSQPPHAGRARPAPPRASRPRRPRSPRRVSSARRLDVSHAFHSPLMAGMDVKMRRVVVGVAAAGAPLRHRLVHHRRALRLGRRGAGDLGAARDLAGELRRRAADLRR